MGKHLGRTTPPHTFEADGCTSNFIEKIEAFKQELPHPPATKGTSLPVYLRPGFHVFLCTSCPCPPSYQASSSN